MGVGQTNTPMNTAIVSGLTQVNEVELVYRNRVADRPQVTTSADAYELLKPAYGDQLETRELAVLLLLDRGGRAKGLYRLSAGGLHGTMMDPKLVFCAALKTLASSVIVSHNHPSGQLRPSAEDITLTKKLMEGARLLDLVLMDHVILTANGYYSFADNLML